MEFTAFVDVSFTFMGAIGLTFEFKLQVTVRLTIYTPDIEVVIIIGILLENDCSWFPGRGGVYFHDVHIYDTWTDHIAL